MTREEGRIEPSALSALTLALQWLAAEPDKALAAVPPAALVPDEIANDIDTWFGVTRDNGSLRGAALVTVAEIEGVMEAWSGPEHAEFWSDEAFRGDPVWGQLRTLARQALRDLGSPRLDDDLAGRV